MALFGKPRPRIAVTGPDRGGLFAWLFTRHAIRRCGGHAIRVTPMRWDEDLAFDGLVIGGGADVDPDRYGAEPALPRPERNRSLGRWIAALILYPLLFFVRRLFSSKHAGGLDRDRDELEHRLLDTATREDIPVLGICRGAQLMNVYLDGSLHQDISNFYSESPQTWTILPRKTVQIAADTRLREILATERCQVNALHNQSIDRTGRDLRVSAREDNGVIQAIEGTGDRFFIGVQWHPEYLPHDRRQQRLFAALVAVAGNRSSHHAKKDEVET